MIKRTITLLLTLTLMHSAMAEDGSRLWLRYEPVNKVNVTGAECLAADELKNYYNGPEVTLKLDATLPDEAYQISGNGNKISICAKSEINWLLIGGIVGALLWMYWLEPLHKKSAEA